MTYIHTDTSLTVLSCDDQWQWKCIFSNRFAWFWYISNNFSFCQGFPVVLYLISPIAGQTGAGCRHKELLYTSSGQRTSKNLIFALKFGLLVSLYLCNKHARFHWDILQKGPWFKFDFLKILVGRGQENIGAAMFSSPQKLSTAHTGIKWLLDWLKSTVLL